MIVGARNASYQGGFGSYGVIGAKFARRYDRPEYRGLGSWGDEALKIAERAGLDVVSSVTKSVAEKLTGGGGSKPPPPPPPEPKKGLPWGWIAGGAGALVLLVVALRR